MGAFTVWEKPSEPAFSGYAARGAVGPGVYGPAPFQAIVAKIFQNQFAKPAYPGPYTTPVGCVLGTGWTYNLPYRQVEINTTPAGNVDMVATMDQGAPVLTLGEKIQVCLLGKLEVGTMTVLVGGVSIGTITPAQWNAAVVAAPGLGLFRFVTTAPATGNTVTLRFGAAAAKAQFSVLSIFRDYAKFADFRAANSGDMT